MHLHVHLLPHVHLWNDVCSLHWLIGRISSIKWAVCETVSKLTSSFRLRSSGTSFPSALIMVWRVTTFLMVGRRASTSSLPHSQHQENGNQASLLPPCTTDDQHADKAQPPNLMPFFRAATLAVSSMWTMQDAKMDRPVSSKSLSLSCRWRDSKVKWKSKKKIENLL